MGHVDHGKTTRTAAITKVLAEGNRTVAAGAVTAVLDQTRYQGIPGGLAARSAARPFWP